jgi:hypothetical protein
MTDASSARLPVTANFINPETMHPPAGYTHCTPLRRPDPAPATFGYHEVFHLLVIAGVAAHFLAIGLYALPTG